MQNNLHSNLEKILNNFIEKNVIIIQDGFLQSKYFIQKFKFSIEYEILNITDEKTDNYLNINLNQMYKIDIKENGLKFYLDNDTEITVNIK